MATTASTTPAREEEDAAALDLDLLILDPPHPPRPMPRFYISGVSATYNPTALATLRLTHLVSIGAEPGKILASQFRPGHTFLSLPDILDVEEQDLLSSLLPSLLPFLAATTPIDSILVHCEAGQSRSVTAVLMYLIICQGMTLVEAHAHVARSRPGVCVNSGFLRQLLFLEDFSTGLALGKASFSDSTKSNTKENRKGSLPSFLDGSSRDIRISGIRLGKSSSLWWAAEHRLYLLSNLFRATCRLSSSDPGEVQDQIEKEHKEVREMLIRFGHGNFSSPPEEEEEGGKEEEARGGGWIARCRHCRQVLCTEKDAVRHAGVEMKSMKRRTRACVGEVGGAAPGAESVWEYERGFERRPVLHFLPLSHAFVKARKAEKKTEREGKRRRIEIEKRGVEGIEEDGSRRTKCPYRYVYPPSWVFPALFASERGGGGGNGRVRSGGEKGKKHGGGGGRGGGREGGMVSIRCPGRHCGAVVGSMQARPQEGGREGGGVCECLEALPVVVVRLREEELVIERVEEEEGGREGGKER